jgi:hypothetical protein
MCSIGSYLLSVFVGISVFGKMACIGWAPTIGGLSLTASGKKDGPAAPYQLDYLAFFYGKLDPLAISFGYVIG